MQEIAAAVHRQVLDLFDYVPDKEQFDLVEDWRSYASEVKRGERFSDDCDAFAVTCSELLAENGAKSSDISLILCRTETGGMHLCCGLSTDETTLILDNRQRSVWDYGQLDYTWIKRVTADDPQHWKEIV